MRHFLIDGQVHGFDENDDTQIPLIVKAIAEECKEVDWPPPMSAEDLKGLYTLAAQQQLNAIAQVHGYHDMISAVSYASSKNKRFKADAAALSAWRDEVWDWAHNNQSIVRSIEEITALLPIAPEPLP